jgi:hypothetical protein
VIRARRETSGVRLFDEAMDGKTLKASRDGSCHLMPTSPTEQTDVMIYSKILRMKGPRGAPKTVRREKTERS